MVTGLCARQMRHAALKIFLDLCYSRVMNVDGHLGHICSCLLDDVDRPPVAQFLRTFFQRNKRELSESKLL